MEGVAGWLAVQVPDTPRKEYQCCARQKGGWNDEHGVFPRGGHRPGRVQPGVRTLGCQERRFIPHPEAVINFQLAGGVEFQLTRAAAGSRLHPVNESIGLAGDSDE